MGNLGGANVENARGGNHLVTRCAPALPPWRRMWRARFGSMLRCLAPAITQPNLAFR